MRLYHERQSDRIGGIDVRDEEECFTAAGRRVGVFLSTEAVRGPAAFVVEVEEAAVADYEVSDAGAAERSFVVPGAIAAGLGLQLA